MRFWGGYVKKDITDRRKLWLIFTIDETKLRFWNNEHKFVSESGLFEISTGYADHLIFTKNLNLI